MTSPTGTAKAPRRKQNMTTEHELAWLMKDAARRMKRREENKPWPEDKGLGKQLRDIEDVPSLSKVVYEHFFGKKNNE